MKQSLRVLVIKIVASLLAVILLSADGAWARPTTPGQAKALVQNWLGREARPLGASLGEQIRQVQTFADAAGNPTYYVVYLNPTGLVFLPADDLVEPIIGFVSQAIAYDPSPANPLGALVSRDIPGRVRQARELEAKNLDARISLAPAEPPAKARQKWSLLGRPAAGQGASADGISAPPSEQWVAPLLQTQWNQAGADGSNPPTSYPCYNYYTPPFASGSGNNYVTGCVATALAQLLRYFQWPANGVGTPSFNIHVHNVLQTRALRGGDGSGGPYDWAKMPNTTDTGTPDDQRQAIGALCADAGVAINMWYDTVAQGGSGAYLEYCSWSLANTFSYGNAISASTRAATINIPGSTMYNIINPNLDAGLPTLLGIFGPVGGHAIVCDGYGYDTATLYHHLNMGWSGQSDAWYNLPNINATYSFNVIESIVYNVYTSGGGEIISGRVTTSGGAPVDGATVTATGASGSYTAVSNAQGIYALPKVPSGSILTVCASKRGYTFPVRVVSTGISISASAAPAAPGGEPLVAGECLITGNCWGINFIKGAAPPPAPPVFNEALDNRNLAFSTFGNADWLSESNPAYYCGMAARSGDLGHLDNQYSGLMARVMGPGKVSFYWKVSSEPTYDFLNFYVDANRRAQISGEVDWVLVTQDIPAGAHTISWIYTKDQGVSTGTDCGWLDRVVYTRKNSPALYLLLLQD